MKELTGKFGTYLMNDDGFYLEKPDGVHWYCNDLVETGQHVLYGCGGRGIGKTYNTRLTAMDQFRIPVEELCNADPKKVEKALDAGEVHRFVYMRRRDKEIQLERRKMFSRYPYDIRKNWKVNKGNIITYKGMEAGYMIDLDHVRGAGIDFANVNTIINDEFISHKSGANAYLPKEYQIFQGAVDSIIRYDNNTRVFAMSNAVSVYNPYFLNEGYMPTGQKMWQNPARHVAVEWCETSKELLDARKKSWFAEWTADTEYGNFSLYNKALRDNDNFIKTKGRYAVLRYMWRVDDRLFGIWYDKYSNDVFFSENTGNKNVECFEMSTIDKEYGTQSRRAFMTSYAGGNLIQRLDKGYVFFESQLAKQAFFTVMKGSF